MYAHCITIIPINVYDQANVALIMIGELFGSKLSSTFSRENAQATASFEGNSL